MDKFFELKEKICCCIVFALCAKTIQQQRILFIFRITECWLSFLKIDYTEKIEENQIQYFEIWGGFFVVHLLSESSQNSELLNQIEGAL